MHLNIDRGEAVLLRNLARAAMRTCTRILNPDDQLGAGTSEPEKAQIAMRRHRLGGIVAQLSEGIEDEDAQGALDGRQGPNTRLIA